MKTVAKILAYFTAFMYFTLGLLFVFNPVGASTGLGYESLNAAGIIEVRASYGGLWISIAFFIMYLLKGDLLKEALYLSLFSFLGFGLGRLTGALFNGGFAGNHFLWFMTEIIYAFLCVLFIVKLSPKMEIKSEA